MNSAAPPLLALILESLILRPCEAKHFHMAIPSLGMGRSVHRDPEILLWGAEKERQGLPSPELLPDVDAWSQVTVSPICRVCL